MEKERTRQVYLALCGSKLLGRYQSFAEALEALRGCRSGRAEVLACRQIALLGPEELASLGAAAEEKAATSPEPGAEGRAEAAGAVVVLDQMFKTFAEILDRELHGLPLEFHEVLGRGIERTVRVSERVYQEPARDDYDILRLLEGLAQRRGLVIFFTGDKRLAAQARTIPGVVVEYLPPGEAGGKEQAIKLMVSRIRRIVEERARGVRRHPGA